MRYRHITKKHQKYLLQPIYIFESFKNETIYIIFVFLMQLTVNKNCWLVDLNWRFLGLVVTALP